jgi:hypothetical protein
MVKHHLLLVPLNLQHPQDDPSKAPMAQNLFSAWNDFLLVGREVLLSGNDHVAPASLRTVNTCDCA